jgi:D-glycero-D-manno-heptose 1,7-bisphosphate phosphatase
MVVFLDRDGVINHDSPDYVKSWEEFTFIPGSLEAIRRLTRKQIPVIIITNQSAVGRKLITIDGLAHIHRMLIERVNAHGGKITDIFFCPHLPTAGCGCRKPKPGLIHMAQKKYTITPGTACMVGDSVKDMECAKNAGCGYAVLVRTGNGRSAESLLKKKNIHPDFVARDLLDAVGWITSLIPG